MTNAAVSQQIKLLEEHLRLKLFLRRNNQLLLSNDGENYLPRVREALRALQQATDMVMDQVNTQLRIAVLPTFGAKWLVPRLYRFLNRYPDIRVEVSTVAVQDYSQYDLCIDDRQSDAANLDVEWFASTDFFPVGNVRMKTQICCAADLATHTLLHERGSRYLAGYPTWQQWFDEMGQKDIDASRGPAFSDASMALQVAMDGQGVALGQRILVQYDIGAGRLVRLLPTQASLRLSYYLIYRREAAQNPNFSLFRHWLNEEAETYRESGSR